MFQKRLCAVLLSTLVSVGASTSFAGDHARANKWVDISDDKNLFDKNCDYKVWLLEEKEWRETWYLEAFDAQNAFYTINRQSSTWNDKDDFYALNYKDKTKFLIGDNFIEVIPFELCLNRK